MEMDAATIGFTMIGILQVANLAWTGVMNSKIDSMVTDSQCKERKKACSSAHTTALGTQKKEIRIVERKMDAHVHNGGGNVKYQPYET